jgi:hypothetical protein
VGVAVLLSGCSDPQSVELRSRRHESLSWTVETLAKTESQSPKSMAWALGTLHEQHERDLENSSKNPARVGAFIQNDFDRWKANQPAYNHAIQRELEGHPDNIGRTAPKLVW